MSARILDGKSLAARIRTGLKDKIAALGFSPGMAILLANTNEASAIYVRRKMKACEEVGITPTLYRFGENNSEDDILSLIQKLNHNKTVHGIFLQLPVDAPFDSHKLIQAIAPEKDVDGLSHVNIGRLVSGIPALAPCTPKGIMTLLRHENIALSGKHAVVVGRSVLFGKPMGQMLLNANCTVTYCHSKTNDLPSMTRQADILIAAAGQADFIKDNWVKKGVIVIDGGINRLENGSITGDVDFESVKHVAAAITPVPGGVGPMTVASLLENTYQAASLIRT